MALGLLAVVPSHLRELLLNLGDHIRKHGPQVARRAGLDRDEAWLHLALSRQRGRARASAGGVRKQDVTATGAFRRAVIAARSRHGASSTRTGHIAKALMGQGAMLATRSARGTRISITLRKKFRSAVSRRVVSAARSRLGAIHPSRGHRDQAFHGSRARLANHRARGTHTTTRGSWQQNNRTKVISARTAPWLTAPRRKGSITTTSTSAAGGGKPEGRDTSRTP